MTPALRSLRLILHPYTPMLVSEEHVSWLNDKDLMRYSEQRHKRHDLYSQQIYAGGYDGNRNLWLLRCNGVDIGTISAYTDNDNSRANLGVLIGKREYQGQGLAAEAWTAVIDWLFDNGFHKVECGCREDNAMMRRLAVTTGMTLEAEIPGHFKVGDEFKGLVLYGRFKVDKYRSEWQKVWQPPFWDPARNA